MQPRQSYLVCATPRSGSTLFCEVLTNTRMMGNPKEFFEFLKGTALPRQPQEYFETLEDETVSAALGRPPLNVDTERLAQWTGAGYARYLEAVLEEGTTSNGVFSAKMMWGYFGDFLHFVRQIPAYQDLSTHTLLTTIFPNLQYVQVIRRDKFRQAVSLWKAIQTQHWRKIIGPENNDVSMSKKELVFHFAAIQHLEQYIIEQELAWQHYFSTHGLQTLTIFYEDMVTALDDKLRETLQYLAITAPDDLTYAEPNMQRQADKQSEDWVERYRQLKCEHEEG
jgi:trehalose 2-sulfotransferase